MDDVGADRRESGDERLGDLDVGIFQRARLQEAEVTGTGFTEDDAWDIGAIASLFALSNRIANMSGMRPNDEFLMLGRTPRGG